MEILNSNPEKEDKELGVDPDTGKNILLKVGPYGPYVQLGDTKTRKSIPKNVELENINIEYALSLLSLPRNIGEHPESKEPIFADYGRYGPYIKMGKKNASLRGPETPSQKLRLGESESFIVFLTRHSVTGEGSRPPGSAFGDTDGYSGTAKKGKNTKWHFLAN